MNMLQTIIPKSNQLNADDLIGGQTRTIKISKVSLSVGDQPCSINYDGDNGKPYKPGKSMCRVLVHVWGEDANKYVGKSLTLYRDDKVMFGGVNVGGIRISHMSGITAPVTMALTITRANRKPFTVLPLTETKTVAPDFDNYLSDISTSPSLEGLAFKFKEAYKLFPDADLREELTKAKDARKIELNQKGEENGEV